MRRVNLNARQYACKQMQKMFPVDLGNVWVEYATDLVAPELPALDALTERGYGILAGIEEGAADADVHA